MDGSSGRSTYSSPATAAAPLTFSFWDADFLDAFSQFSLHQRLLLLVGAIAFIATNVTFFRLASVLGREKPGEKSPRPKPSSKHPTHLLVVLGSGGHTAEMLNILQQTPFLPIQFTYRTYVVSSGDGLSAQKAADFEIELIDQLKTEGIQGAHEGYDIVTVHRARRVHQGILTAPFSTVQCLWDCVKVLRGTHPDLKSHHGLYPDLILTNGPGTGVCVVLAATLLIFLGLSGPPASSSDAEDQPYPGSGQMRTIFIESWARVKTLSLSGKILKPFVDRFLVQWPPLVQSEGSRVEYIGPLVT